MDKDQARKQWNSAAPGWAKWEPVIGKWLRRSTDAMLDAAGVGEGVQLVDIACGAGDQSFAAAHRAGPRGQVVATDISEEMIGFVEAQARAANLENLVARCCGAEDLTDLNATFDAAICRLGLMHMASAGDAEQMIQDAFGVYRAIIGDQGADVQQAAWSDVLQFLKEFEDDQGFTIPAQFHVGSGVRPS